MRTWSPRLFLLLDVLALIAAVVVCCVGSALLRRPAAPAVQPVPMDTTASHTHVLVPGDSVQWGGMTGEILRGWIVPHGKKVVLELDTRGGRK